MLPTEIQRILLLIGLAATGYLMILAWNEDFIQGQAPVETVAAPEPVTANGGMPTVAGGETGGGPGGALSDVPDASLIVTEASDGESARPAEPAREVTTRDRLIRVKTPELNVWIDRLGGDIVRVELPDYPITLDAPDQPYVLLDHSLGRTYIAQSGLIGPDGVDGTGQRPLYEAGSAEYRMTGDQPLLVELTAEADGQAVSKTFHFTPGEHLVRIAYRVANHRSEPLKASLFAQIKRDDHEPVDAGGGMALGPQPYVGAALTTPDSRYEKLDFDDLEEDGTYRVAVDGGWIAFLQHYFLSAWVAQADERNNFYGQKRPDGTYVFGYTGPLKTIAPGAQGAWETRFYAGPKDQKRLEEIAPNLNLTVDYGFLWWLAVPLFYVLDWFYGVFGNWGVAIIMLTVLVKLVLYPLSAASYRSMANMRRVAPQMKRLQERYADDRQKLSQEMMNLYKKEQVNPLGGCLPMLLPMPIFIALYWVLFEAVELRHAPFVLWINDLSAMDPYFILPLLMGGSMYLTQLMSPAVGDPMQVRMMKMMPILFTVLFLFFPSGLVLYWLVNNILGVAQQYYVIRQTERAQEARS